MEVINRKNIENGAGGQDDYPENTVIYNRKKHKAEGSVFY
jgi:hypothetical protein